MTIYFKNYTVQVINKGSWAPVNMQRIIKDFKSLATGQDKGN
jgi:hypothetical protein